MGYFKKKIGKFVKWALDYREDCTESSPSIGYSNSLKSSSTSHPMPVSVSQMNNGLNFTIFNANGGKVIQVHHYDTKTDRGNTSLHIITDSDSFAEELAIIVTRESLMR